ncbi:hypothetical protein BJ165DRAFT_264666 [Panaeolus papilionaceus]|nr:hypothetical protein BJ165DRAFT_264666 [Panaeolus papilionaceus]
MNKNQFKSKRDIAGIKPTPLQTQIYPPLNSINALVTPSISRKFHSHSLSPILVSILRLALPFLISPAAPPHVANRASGCDLHSRAIRPIYTPPHARIHEEEEAGRTCPRKMRHIQNVGRRGRLFLWC